MAYCVYSEIKTDLDIPVATTDFDSLLTAYCTAVEAAIDATYGFKFTAQTETRYFDPTRDVRGPDLILDKPLLTISANGLVNGDGTVIASTKYKLWPANAGRYYKIRLLASSGYYWTYSTDPENAISVAGTWGWSATCPTWMNIAVRKWVAYIYQDRKSANMDVIGMLETGQMIIQKGIPALVQVLLKPVSRSPL